MPCSNVVGLWIRKKTNFVLGSAHKSPRRFKMGGLKFFILFVQLSWKIDLISLCIVARSRDKVWFDCICRVPKSASLLVILRSDYSQMQFTTSTSLCKLNNIRIQDETMWYNWTDKTNNGIENWHCNSSSTSIKMSITAKIK